jgi:peroxiredoxin Q/BCP
VEDIMAELKKGDRAPGFSLKDQDGNSVSLENFKKSKVLLYFYPRADTPGCTKQACSIRDNMAALKKLGVVVLGISPDAPERQKKFDDKYTLGFPLLSDTSHEVAGLYGVWKKLSLGIIRSSFLIGEDGRILESWYRVKPQDTVSNAVKVLEG